MPLPQLNSHGIRVRGTASSSSSTSLSGLHDCDSASFATPNLVDSMINVLFFKRPESLDQYTGERPNAGAPRA